MKNRRKPTDGVQRYVEGDFRREKQKYNYLCGNSKNSDPFDRFAAHKQFLFVPLLFMIFSVSVCAFLTPTVKKIKSRYKYLLLILNRDVYF